MSRILRVTRAGEIDGCGPNPPFKKHINATYNGFFRNITTENDTKINDSKQEIRIAL